MFFLLAFDTDTERDNFDYLFHNYKNLMLHKAFEVLKDAMLAEDAVSEAFIRIFRNIKKIDDPSSNSTRSFIVTIVRNVAINLYNKRNNQPISIAEYYDDYEKADTFDIENHIISELSSEEIFRLISELKEDYRSVFLLKYARDLSYKEIADLLGITENLVAVRLNRARNAIIKILEREGYLHETAEQK